MKQRIEYINYPDSDRITILENKAAELERRLRAANAPASGFQEWHTDVYPELDVAAVGEPAPEISDVIWVGAEPVSAGGPVSDFDPDEDQDEEYGEEDDDEYGYPGPAYPRHGAPRDGAPPQGGPRQRAPKRPVPDRRAALVNHGRRRAKRTRTSWLRSHWRATGIVAASVFLAAMTLTLLYGRSSPGWPSSVATVQAEISAACQNPNVAAEPSQSNFACAKDSQQVLWVFSLLTSGDNAAFTDQATGREGLEPIQPSQGGDIAFALNLHHPYNPDNAVDSLQVAARAINNIISGGTLTTSKGGPLVEPGLESSSANCLRYTGSARLISKAGFPPRCAAPVTTSGETQLVSDVFQQWMGGTPSQIAAEAGVLFANANNPGNSQVQAILATLPGSVR